MNRYWAILVIATAISLLVFTTSAVAGFTDPSLNDNGDVAFLGFIHGLLGC